MVRWDAVVVVVMVVVAAVAASEVQQEHTKVEAADGQVATGRTFSEMGESISNFFDWMMGYDDYDEDYYDDYGYELDGNHIYSTAIGDYGTSGYSQHAQVGYGLPAVGYVAPSGSGGHGFSGQHSSYSSYSPYQVVHQPQHFSYNARKDDFDEDEWGMEDYFWGALAVAGPVLLMTSAFPANLLTVAIRRRSFDDGSEMAPSIDPAELPLLRTVLEDKDFTPLFEPRCQRKLFCEITKIGEKEDASFMQRAFYYVAMLMPDRIARRVGLARTFRAARAGDCETLVCNRAGYLTSLAPPAVLPPSNHLSEPSSSSSSSSDASSDTPELEE